MSEQNQRGEELFDKLNKDKKRRRNKIIRTVLIVIAVLIVVLIAAIVILRKNVEARFAADIQDVQAYTVSTGTIHTVVAGSGILAEVDQEQLRVPSGVEVTEVVVEAGDTVQKGDLLATVDMATVMTTLADLQAQMKDLDSDISAAKGEEVSSYVTAGVSGRVKTIYAQKDMDVSLCMAENGALAVLSLDGYMAADLETDKLTKGQSVTVTRADGSTISGTVDSAAGGSATILVTDNGPKVDEEITVTAEDGAVIGKGKLYIHNPLAVTGYAGTISSVAVSENSYVYSYSTVFNLKNTSFSANYDTLLRDRADLEEQLLDLLTIYRDGAMLSPMDGMISSVEFDDGDGSTTTSAASAAAAYGYGTTTAATTSASGENDVLTLYPNISMSITISIDETDILALEEGQEAEVVVSSVSEEQVHNAVVTDISKVADTSTGVTQYSAEVTLDKAAGMLPGMTADVDIKIEGVENALIIPVDALHQTSTIYYVYTEYDEETMQYGGMKEVTIGMQNDTQVEILSGLNVGDVIYYTEAPQNIFAMFAAMSGMGGGGMNQRPGGQMPGGMNRGG